MATQLPVTIKSTIGKPKVVLVAQAVDATSKQGQAVGVPGWDWDGKDSVIIRSLPNLVNGTYTVSFWFISG